MHEPFPTSFSENYFTLENRENLMQPYHFAYLSIIAKFYLFAFKKESWGFGVLGAIRNLMVF
jgi:hypothetical protein